MPRQGWAGRPQGSCLAKRLGGKAVKLRAEDSRQSPKALLRRGVWQAELWENPCKPGEKPPPLGKSANDQQI
jgi:hypothetical protein